MENDDKKIIPSWNLVNFCEVDKFAATSYCAIHGVDPVLNIGDITKVDENNMLPFNMICGGSPCFPAGTLISTKKGLKAIENINVGDYVLTHKNRYMPVDNVGGEIDKEIYIMKAQGFLDIFATSYHPFYVKRNKYSNAEKMKMEDIKKGFYIASPINTKSDNYYDLTDEQCWILGRYVADGHIRHDKRKDRIESYQYGVVLSVGNSKVEEVKNNITSYNYSCYPHTESTHRVVISSKELVEFIEKNKFGTSALTKTIPQFILDLPVDKLEKFLNGYMSGDGCEIKDSGLYSATTISRELAINLREAIQKVYRVGCRTYYTETEDTCVIEGRTVNQNDTYIIRFIKDTTRKHLWFIEDNKIWYPVKSVDKTSRIENVYNIEVNSDHTYVADGIVVFNCQDFSIAGKKAGSGWTCKDCTGDDGEPFTYNPLTVHWSKRDKCPNCGSENLDKTRSSLLVEWLRVVRANKPAWGIYENVKNIVGKSFRNTFDMFIEELHEYGYNTYWKVLNAKDFGIPQNRERLYLVIIRKELDNGNFDLPDGFESDITIYDILEDEENVPDKYYVDSTKEKKALQEMINSGKLNKSYSNTIRHGGGKPTRKE